MKPEVVRRNRQQAAVWGAIAATSLAGVVVAWLGSPTAAGHATFGRTGSVAMVVLALVVTLFGIAAVVVSRRPPPLLRWSLALPVAAGAGGVGVLAAGGLFVPDDGTDTGFGVLLALGTVGMCILAAHVARSAAGPADRSIQN